MILVIVIIILFIAILIPQYNAYRSRLAFKMAVQSVKSDITRAIALAKNSTPGNIAIPPALPSPGALTVFQPSGVVFTDTLPPNIVIYSKTGYCALNAGSLTGAAAVEFPGGGEILIGPQGSLLNCAGGADTDVTTTAVVCGGVTFPAGSPIQALVLADPNNIAFLCIDTRTGAITGP